MEKSNSLLINRKLSARTTIFIIIITIVFIIVLTMIGEKAPVVNVLDDRIEIKSMFGTTISKDDIAEISILDKSMREIGVGLRTNGYGGFTGTYKGQFKANDGSAMLVFAQVDAAPTIQIQTKNGPPVFISFRDNNRTKELVQELIEKYQLMLPLDYFNDYYGSQ